MPIERLTPQFVQLAYCPEGKRKVDYYDDLIPGFMLEVRHTGATFHLRYQDDHGRLKQLKIGTTRDITVAQARKKAKQLRAQVVLGGDPAAKRKEKKAVPTYNELADQHLAYAETYQKAPENTASVMRVHLRPRWGKLHLDEITTQDIAKWFAEKRDAGLAPATVEKIRIVLNRSFELALRWKMPGIASNPIKGIPRRKFSNGRNRFLSPEEAEKLQQAVTASSNPQLKHIVGLLLLTGARKGELLKAKWQDVDLERRAWFIPDSKTGKSRHVPLSQAAVDIINQLPRWEKCPWLLPNPETREPYNDVKRAWDTARRAAGMPDLRLHDLRHSAASAMVSSSVPLYTVGRILGHADFQSTARYSHVAQDTLLDAVEAGAAKLNWAGGSDGV